MADYGPQQGHAPIPMLLCGDEQTALNGNVGYFYWDFDRLGHDYIGVMVPAAHTEKGRLFVLLPITTDPGKRERHWLWDGNKDKPTLSPSIGVHGIWHGLVKAGQLEEA